MKKLTTIATTVALVLTASAAFAQDGVAATGTTDASWIAIAAALAIGLAAIGGALGQGRAVTAALDSIGRNPGAAGKITTPMIIGLALIESLVIYALVVAIILTGKF